MATAHSDVSAIVSLLVAFIVALWRGWIVFGTTHAEMEKNLAEQLKTMTDERNSWRSVSLTSTTLAESLVAVARVNNGVAPFGSAPNGKIN